MSNFGIPENIQPAFDGHIAPAGAHSEGQRAHRGRFNDISQGFFKWVRKQMPTPGANAYALESFGLVEFDPVNTGIIPKFFFRQLQGNVVRQDSQAVVTSGLGGLVTGSIRLTPLYDPATNTFGGVSIGSGSSINGEFKANQSLPFSNLPPVPFAPS